MATAVSRAVNKYIKENYSRITLLCRPDEAYTIRKWAERYNMSYTQFVLLCVRRYIGRLEAGTEK